MKKNIYKILTFLFFFFMFFSFSKDSSAENIFCATDKDCPYSCICTKVDPLSERGMCLSIGSDTSCYNTNAVVTSTCSWTAETTQSDPETGYSTIIGGCGFKEVRSDGNKCPGKKPESSYTAGTTDYICCCKETATATINEKTPDLNPLGNLQVKIPGLDKIANEYPAKCETDAKGKTVCSIPWIAVYIKAVYNYMLIVGGIVAVITLMIGGIIWLVSAGNATRISEAKSWIFGSITGVIILLSSYILLNQINPNLVNYKTLTLDSIEPAEIDNSFDDTAENPYLKACQDAKAGNLNTCKSLSGKVPSGLTAISSNLYANKAVYEKYQKAMDCVKTKNNGKNLFTISQSWRSPQGQIKAKEDWTKEGKPENAATPCCSNHGSGKAFDLRRVDSDQKMSWAYNDSSGLKECMNAQGLYANLKTEPWHWSPTGK